MTVSIIIELSDVRKTDTFRNITLYNGIFIKINKTYYTLITEVIDADSPEFNLIESKYREFVEKYSDTVEKITIQTTHEIPETLKKILIETVKYVLNKPSCMKSILDSLMSRELGEASFTPLTLFNYIKESVLYDDESHTILYNGKMYKNINSINDIPKKLKPNSPLLILSLNNVLIYYPGEDKFMKINKE